MKKIILILALLASTICRADEVSPEKRTEILKLFDLTNVLTVFESQKKRLIEIFAAQAPGAPKEMWDMFSAELKLEEYREQLIIVYDKHLSLEDVRAINAFYESPAGKHFSEKTVIMTQEAGLALRKLSEAAVEKVRQAYEKN